MSILLDVENVTIRFDTPEGEVIAADRISFRIAAGETVGLVGESGSGKTQAVLSIMGLLARNGTAQGKIHFNDRDLLALSSRDLNRIRGVDIAMIFQDPMTALNPYLKISRQMTEVLIEHQGMGATAARKKSVELLDQVGIPDARNRIDLYPHEFSGGMRQRVMIATALLCEPKLLIADEPTTALDVTVQAQIMDLLRRLRKERDMAILLITHDLGLVAGLVDRVMVMYAGRIVEEGPVFAMFETPAHPYTQGLLRCSPRLDRASSSELVTIPGQPPNLQALPGGCAFKDRCPHCCERCVTEVPMLRETTPERTLACHLQPAAGGRLTGRRRAPEHLD